MPHSKLLLFLAAPTAALAVSAASTPAVVTVSLDQDILILLRGAVWLGGIFLAVFALIGITFFGWDVRKARASLADAQKETHELLEELKVDFNEMKKLKEKLEQLGAQLEESGTQVPKEPPLDRATERTAIDLIREAIRTSNYDWTTLGRIVNITNLSRENILEEARKAPDVRISTGRKNQDFIFKIKSDT